MKEGVGNDRFLRSFGRGAGAYSGLVRMDSIQYVPCQPSSADITASVRAAAFPRSAFSSMTCVSLRLMKRLYGVHEVGWTIRDREAMERLEREGVPGIFEGFVQKLMGQEESVPHSAACPAAS